VLSLRRLIEHVPWPRPGVNIDDTLPRRSVNIDETFDDLLPDMLLSPGTRATQAIAETAGVAPKIISELITSKTDIKIDLYKVFADELGRFLIEEWENQCKLLSTYDQSRLEEGSVYRSNTNYQKLYLRQTITRVYHLVMALRKLGMQSGKLLEVGSFFGTFAGSLQKLGYQVTAVDRYPNFEGALDGFVNYLRHIGVTVLATTPDDEMAIINQLPNFDVVISMAVIEHIPHTPRYFLETLARRIRPGGLLALDTPNIARYWNRRKLQAGSSIHFDIKDQYFSPIPFEGHHREYTADEMCWMLEQVGCNAVHCELFDYNLLQFPELSHEHIQALLSMTLDPSLADTILVVGRRNVESGR
jgi:2-polyprenyl-3-methyl-5-hydroxy-6-metoxy-1,4-benzoquinol methylase